MAQWIAQEGLSLDVCSAGELAVARSVHFPAERIILHGNAKTPEDLQAAFRYGVGRIVVDSASEIIRLATLSPPGQRVLIRVTPGVDAHAHRAVATGVEDQKFGFSLGSGAAADAVHRVLAHPELKLAGLHCHLGSQLTSLVAYEVAARKLIGLMAAVRDRSGIALAELNLGGGHAVPYVAGDADFDLAGFADRMRRVISDECARFRLPVPWLTLEPGRAIVNRAMVTLYRVLAVKHAHRRQDVRRRGRRHERQPEAGALRRAVLRARGTAVSRAAGDGDRGGASLRGGGRARGGRAAARGYPARRPWSPCPAPARTPIRWRPTTTWSGGRR